jgi:hypothetical protein
MSLRKSRGARIAAVIAGASVAFWVGYDLMDYTNQTLGFVCWWVAGSLVLYAVTEWLWIRSNRWLWGIRAIGCIVIGCLCVLVGHYCLSKPIPTNADIAKKIDDVRAALNKEAVESNEEEENRLKREYPLGYVIFAFSGEKIVHLLCTDRVDSDWDRVKVYREGKDLVFIEPLYLFDKREDKHKTSGFVSCAFGMPAKPGGKSIRIRVQDSFMARAECIRAKPVGLCVVLGFMECESEK